MHLVKLAACLLLLLLLLVSCCADVSTLPTEWRRPRYSSPWTSKRIKLSSSSRATTLRMTPTLVALTPTTRAKLSHAVGVAMGIGATFLYAPILAASIADKRHLDGQSLQTWTLNVVGAALSVIYSLKNGFPLSMYVESVALGLQAALMWTLLCARQQQYTLLIGVAGVLVGMAALLLCCPSIPAPVYAALQAASMGAVLLASIPQIVLTFRLKSSSWSPITALFSVLGCVARIFTTLSLTRDSVLLLGYSVGLVTNSILLAQVLWYGGPSSLEFR